jgi:hypothetical protein
MTRPPANRARLYAKLSRLALDLDDVAPRARAADISFDQAFALGAPVEYLGGMDRIEDALYEAQSLDQSRRDMAGPTQAARLSGRARPL